MAFDYTSGKGADLSKSGKYPYSGPKTFGY